MKAHEDGESGDGRVVHRANVTVALEEGQETRIVQVDLVDALVEEAAEC